MSSNFLQFNPNSSNQESDAAYSADGLRENGISTGSIMPSAMLNKLFYQLSTWIAAQAGAWAAKGYTVSDANLGTLQATFGNLLTAADIRTNASYLGFSNSPIFDAVRSTKFMMTLTGNVASSAVINQYPGDLLVFVLSQDGTGGRTFAWPNTFYGAPPVAQEANAVTIASFFAMPDGSCRAMTPGVNS